MDRNFFKTELSEEDLKNVSGGSNTGDFDSTGKKVYIAFPFPYNFMSGFKSVSDIESMANTFIGNLNDIKPYITDTIKSAVASLYSANGATMSANVNAFFA